MSEEELRPCPFCGETATLDYRVLPFGKHWFITCDCCGMMYQDVISQRKYVKDGWNTRPIEDELTARIAELESAQRWKVVADGELPDDDVEVFVLLYGSSVSTGKHYRNARHLDLEDNSYDLNYVIGDYWLIGDDETTCAQHYYNAVTHWMPLPEPPNDTQTDSVVYGKERD